MTATTTAPKQQTPVKAAPAGHRLGRWMSNHLLIFIGIVVLGYLFLPIAFVVLMSFNDPSSRLAYEFQSFTFDNWLNPCGADGLCQSVLLSVEIGLLATVGATILGTLMAFAMVRHRYRGRETTNVLIFLPMATPEVVMGSSLLALFVSMGLSGHLGFWTILVAHIMFCLSFVVVTVKARLSGMDSSLEEAAMDLYASEWETFRRVTLPLVFPGILAAALLSFSLSFDDFIVTNFNSGTTVTFPLFVWGSAQRGIPPQVNVVGTMMFLIAFALVAGSEVLRRVRRP